MWRRRRVRARLRPRRGGSVAFGRIALGASAGAFVAGIPGVLIGAAVAASWDRIAAERERRSRARRLDEQVPDVLRSIAAAVRAGRSLSQALAAAHEEAPEPIRGCLQQATEALDVGAPVDEAIEAFARAAGTEQVAVAAETMRIGRAAGGDFPRVLETAVEATNVRIRIARDRRAGASQARMSAAVVAAMPLVFYALVGSGARGRLVELLAEPIGWVIVGLGLALDAAGVAWMRAMNR